MRTIHVAFATDKGYLKQTCIAIESVLLASESDETHYHFYVLMPFGDIDAAEDYFERIQNKYMTCMIQSIGIGNVFDNAAIRIEHITKVTYYRLLLPELIEPRKCIYLDSDIIVCRNLTKLYDIDIDDYDLGGVIAPSYINRKAYAEKIGIPCMDKYINAGVLLLNLEQMRKSKFTEKALELIDLPFPTQDQDIINRVSYNKIKLLPFKYNMPTMIKKYPDILSSEELEEAETQPVVLHYACAEKPWECLDINYADEWWKVCRHSFLFNTFLEEQKNSFFYYGVINNLSFWKMDKGSPEWFKEVKRYAKCYVYGAGKIGEKAVICLKENGIQITGILVSDLAGNKSSIQGINVSKFTEDIEEDALIFLAVSGNYQPAIKRLLFRYGKFYVMPFYEI